jgi:hypothetical protein
MRFNWLREPLRSAAVVIMWELTRPCPSGVLYPVRFKRSGGRFARSSAKGVAQRRSMLLDSLLYAMLQTASTTSRVRQRARSLWPAAGRVLEQRLTFCQRRCKNVLMPLWYVLA